MANSIRFDTTKEQDKFLGLLLKWYEHTGIERYLVLLMGLVAEGITFDETCERLAAWGAAWQ